MIQRDNNKKFLEKHAVTVNSLEELPTLVAHWMVDSVTTELQNTTFF